MGEKVSASLEDYLETFLSLEDEEKHIKMSEVALEIGVSKASVHKAIQVLKERGLVEQEKYRQLEITEEGRKIAIGVRKRHNIIKRFLSDVLKVGDEVADRDACEMEHAVSQETLDKLEMFLKNYKGE